jgi:glycosyltransferase involved in cell wall biosynthesis
MKILFVHDRFGAMAGAEVNAFVTANELKNRGHSVALLHGARTGKCEADWSEVFSPTFCLDDDGAAEAVEHAISLFQPDLIYVHKMADLEVIQALAGSGRPVVRMVHDHDLYCMRSYKYNPLTRQICERAASPYCIFPCGATLTRNRGGGAPLKWVSYFEKMRGLKLNRQFQRMIVATEYMREELVRNHFNPQKIEVHPPVPRTIDNPGQSSFSDRNLILYSGQIIRGKGVDVLLEALARVQTAFECIILGEGNHRAYCEQLSRELGLGERVHFKGFVPQNQLQEYYADASLAVMSSVWPEPFGAAGLEGMRHGLPVVAFDAGGIREWLTSGENGFLAPWMDREAFTARIEQLLRDKALARQMGERGRRLIRERFDFAQYIQNLENTFATVLSEAQAAIAA